MKKILTATELARIRKVSVSYICRLCRLKKIKAKKINPRMYIITDEKVLSALSDKYSVDF